MYRSVDPVAYIYRKNRLAFYRVVMGIKQRELARQIGVTTSAISTWERDEAVPRKKHALMIAEVLQIPVRKLWPHEPY